MDFSSDFVLATAVDVALEFSAPETLGSEITLSANCVAE